MAIEAGAGERGRDHVVRDVLRVGEIDDLVLREIGMGQDFHQSGQTHGMYFGHAGDRLGIEAAVTHEAEPAGAFGNEHVAVGKKCQAPGMHETAGHRDYADLGWPGLFARLAAARERWWRVLLRR